MLLTAPKKKVATIIVSSMKPEKGHADFVQKMGDESYEGPEEEYAEHAKVDSEPALQVAAEAVLSAVKKADAKALAAALHSFCQICDEMPHEEGEHEGEDEGEEKYEG